MNPRTVTFLAPHLRPSGGIRHILELASGLLRKGWRVRVRVSGLYGVTKRFKNGSAQEQLSALSSWWGSRDSGLTFEFGSLRTLRPYGEPADRLDYGGLVILDGEDGKPRRTIVSHAQHPDWKGEVIVAFGDGENELFQGSYLRDALAILLVLDWLAFDPERQLRYIQQGTWDGVICSSPFLKDRLSDAGIPEAVVISPGVSRTEFQPIFVPTERLPVLGTMYGTGSKGWKDACIAAGTAARILGSPVILLSYGSEDRPELPDGVENVDMRYIKVPHPEDKREIYTASDVWLCASHTEGFGFPSLEAMACGTPVVTYANGGHSAFQEDGVTGRIVRVGDAVALGRAAAEIISNEGMRERMSGECSRVAKTFTWERSCTQFSDYLDAVRAARGLA